jgi:hypothetical protein
MQETQLGPLEALVRDVLNYLPTLAAGLLILAVGLAVGWVAKRAVVRSLIWLRLDRLGGRYGWRAAFGKGDVRAAMYNLVGNIAMLLVFLIFLDDALRMLQLNVLTRLLDDVVFSLPDILLAAAISFVGIGIANTLADRAEDALSEEFVHARLLAKLLKAALLAVVAALALWELDLARPIVTYAFLIGFGALGLGFALAIALGSAGAVQRGWQELFQKTKAEAPEGKRANTLGSD